MTRPVPHEPPPRVRSELLWRLAALLYGEHVPWPGEDRCTCCRQRWPCSARRLAELALRQAGSRT